jgi:hypothetical protein
MATLAEIVAFELRTKGVNHDSRILSRLDFNDPLKNAKTLLLKQEQG